jgi:hypothetical protein
MAHIFTQPHALCWTWVGYCCEVTRNRPDTRISCDGNKKSHPKVAVYLFLVARGGIEPPTQGFSILCSTD